MRKLMFLPLALVMMLMISCGPDAQKFNDSIVKEQSSIVDAANTFQNKTNSIVSSGKYADLKPQTDSLSAKIDASIERVKALETPKGGEKFKEAATSYFEGFKNIVVIAGKLSTLTEKSSADEVNKIIDEMSKAIDAVQEKESVVKTTQAEFAKAHNMVLR